MQFLLRRYCDKMILATHLNQTNNRISKELNSSITRDSMHVYRNHL